MAKWLIRLTGEEFDLEDLPEIINSPDLVVLKRDEGYFLGSIDLDELASADEVRERGIALVKILNGAAKLHIDNFHPVAEAGVASIQQNGKLHMTIHVGITEIARAKDKVSVTAFSADGSPKPVPPLGPGSQILKSAVLALKHESVADAIDFYRDDNWISLYKAYEIVCDDLGSKHRLESSKWVPVAELSRFTQTAQSRAALGELARHASKSYKPPQNPMTLDEARSLIKRVILSWIQSKL